MFFPATSLVPIPKIVALEGCVGAGKTTIAAGLAKFRGSRLVLEEPDSIPFFQEFYRNPSAFAVETEFAFLLHHYHKLKRAFLERGEAVTDFSLPKDLLFAALNFSDELEQSTFRNLYHLLAGRIPKVTLTIFISISDDLMLARIKQRNRPDEAAASPEYFQRLNAEYAKLIASHEGPSFTLSADSMDFCAKPELFGWLSAQIDKILKES